MAKKKYSPSEATFQRWIKEGCGAGKGRDYKPWLTVRDLHWGRSLYFAIDLLYRDFTDLQTGPTSHNSLHARPSCYILYETNRTVTYGKLHKLLLE